ncbi:MAG: carbohydrate kinase [Bacteroidaceae bacterium]|nr:carbohydrate kinase [Bacteroidaceae bacterium]
MYLLGYDIGTSSVKASLVEIETGVCVASAFYPEIEATIIAKKAGWAEQEPEDWWQNMKMATKKLEANGQRYLDKVKAIGISYQMHGLVCVDKDRKPLRPSIIWCDGRAVPYGNKAFDGIGHEQCLSHLLNSPGNFTAAKLAWVKENEPEVFEKIYKIMLPGDYIAMKLSGGIINTTVSGLSEGMFWDFKDNCISKDVMKFFGFSEDLIPEIVPTFSIQQTVCKEVAEEIGIPLGTPIAYRGGDQPNNALSLNVMNAGEVAATGGTSGVVYGVLDKVNYDTLSRVNTFAHVNHGKQQDGTDQTRLGVLLCINGTGILNAWMRRTVAPEGCSYNDMNQMASSIKIGCDGLSVIPFGNGAERILQNREIGCSIEGLNFNIHTKAHLIRAAQEGVVFSFKQGIDIMQDMGMNITNIHAGYANMFLNPIFCQTLASVTGATINLYETDGAAGAAKGAGIGAGIYKDNNEAFATLKHRSTITPDTANQQAYMDAYQLWKERLDNKLNN